MLCCCCTFNNRCSFFRCTSDFNLYFFFSTQFSVTYGQFYFVNSVFACCDIGIWLILGIKCKFSVFRLFYCFPFISQFAIRCAVIISLSFYTGRYQCLWIFWRFDLIDLWCLIFSTFHCLDRNLGRFTCRNYCVCIALVVWYIALLFFFTIYFYTVIAIFKTCATQTDLRKMFVPCQILYCKVKICSIFINDCFRARILFQFHIQLIIDHIDTFSNTIQRGNRIFSTGFWYCTSITGQSEYRICCNICTDAKKRSIKSLITFSREIVPSIILDTCSSVIYILCTISTFWHGISPACISNIIRRNLSHVYSIKVR